MRNVTSKYMNAMIAMYEQFRADTIQRAVETPGDCIYHKMALAIMKELRDGLDRGDIKIMETSDRIIDYYDKEYKEYKIEGDVEYAGETVQFGDIPPIKMR